MQSLKDKREKILEALEKEYDEHDTCDYHFGCITHSSTLAEAIDTILEEVYKMGQLSEKLNQEMTKGFCGDGTGKSLT